jgi:CheY-like chemotaxis protein
MMRSIVIDDVRNIAADVVCRTYKDGLDALQTNSPFDVLYLDHDLGEMPPQDGYHIACWIETNAQQRPKKVVIVSSNPVGIMNIELALNKVYDKDYESKNTWLLKE